MIVLYNLFFNYAMAMFGFLFCVIWVAHSLSFIISLILLPVGVCLMWFHTVFIRLIAKVDLHIMACFLGINSDNIDMPEVMKLGDRDITRLKLMDWIKACLFDQYTWTATFYYVFIKFWVALFNWILTVVLICVGFAACANIIVLNTCDVCYQNQHGSDSDKEVNYGTKEVEWLVTTNWGGAVLVVIGIVFLMISSVVLEKFASFECRLNLYFLSPSILSMKSISVRLMEEEPLIAVTSTQLYPTNGYGSIGGNNTSNNNNNSNYQQNNNTRLI